MAGIVGDTVCSRRRPPGPSRALYPDDFIATILGADWPSTRLIPNTKNWNINTDEIASRKAYS